MQQLAQPRLRCPASLSGIRGIQNSLGMISFHDALSFYSCSSFPYILRFCGSFAWSLCRAPPDSSTSRASESETSFFSAFSIWFSGSKAHAQCTGQGARGKGQRRGARVIDKFRDNKKGKPKRTGSSQLEMKLRIKRLAGVFEGRCHGAWGMGHGACLPQSLLSTCLAFNLAAVPKNDVDAVW